MVLEAAPRMLGSGAESGGKRAKSDEGSLHEPPSGVRVDGARFFACISSRSLGSSITILMTGTVDIGVLSRRRRP